MILDTSHATTPMCGCMGQASVLMDFYNSSHPEGWTHNDGWGSTNCSIPWYGVTCNGASITSIELNSNNITGTLPSSWSSLVNISRLSLCGNLLLSGTLPPEWSSMTNIATLLLYYNPILSGTLPPEWSSMSKLITLYIFGTNVSGTLPSSWTNMTSMVDLQLYSSPLSGSLPPEWSSMSKLVQLYIMATNISGTLPSTWSSMTSMTGLQLHSNSMLSGSLPPEWSSMSKLSTLYIFATSISGTLPSTWSSMTSMVDLQLYSNPLLSGSLPSNWSSMSKLSRLHIYGTNISSTLPASWGNMTSMVDLQLFSNPMLSGSLPPEWCRMSKIAVLYIFATNVSGMLPPLWSNMTSISNLQLYSNPMLSGTLPPEWSSMSHLVALYIYGTSVSGTLPPVWGNMTSMTDLILNSNPLLSGILPSEWSRMPNMFRLNIFGTNISGTLPSSWSTMTGILYLQLNNNPMLSGVLPSEWSSMSKLELLYIFATNVSGTLPSSWRNLTSMRDLQLYNNPSLSGSLPSEWSRMSNVYLLFIYGTNVSGTLPSSWSTMTSMGLLQLNNNPMLSGTLPTEWSSMSQVTNLYICATNISGTLPSSWSNMTSTVYLQLHSNPMLSGSLPSQWSMMSKLSGLYINGTSISGTLPSSWSALTSLRVLKLSSNSIGGTLPPAWANMTSLQQLLISGNRIVGSVPAALLNVSSLWQLQVQTNCLTGTMPPSTNSLLQVPKAINVCYTKVRGSGPNVSSCPGFQWPEYCNDLVSHTMSASISSATISSTSSPQRRRSDSISASASKGGQLTRATTYSTFSHFAVSESLHPSALPTASIPSMTLSSTVTATAPSPSQWVCNVSGGTVLVQFTPPVAAVGDGGPVAFVVSVESSDNAARGVRLTTNSIPRATLVTSGLWIAMNISITAPGGEADHWVVGGVTISGDALNWTVQSSNTVPWSVIVLRTPTSGWLDASLSLLADDALDFAVKMLCDGAEILEVSISVPAPGVPRVYAEEIATVGRSSQVASAVASVTSGSALGRMMATRSMVLCDADSAVGGGVLDLKLEICGVSGEPSVVARSAVVSNLVFVAVAASALLLLAALWAVFAHTSILQATAVMRMPASLFPALVAIVPSTAASATLLLARIDTSECVASDVVLGIVGLALSTLPAAGFLHLWALRANKQWTTIARDMGGPTTTLHPLLAMLIRTVRRRWEWTTTDHGRKGMERAWPLLLEYRELRYGALDNGVLLALSIVSVVSGLTGSSAQCRGLSLVALLLLVAQLVAVIIVQPLTTTFSQLYAVSTVSLTCLGVLAQLLFVWTVESLWLVDAAAACSLAVLGLSLLNTALNAVQLLAAVRRRIVLLLKLRYERAQLLHGFASSHQSQPFAAVDLFRDSKSLALELDAVMLKAAEESDNESHQLCDNGLFWNSDGAAVGTELVEGHSDIIRTDYALQERLMAQAYDRYALAEA
ncbi:GP46-like surface antigen, putative [Bodo saltans]|uniref:GP46-like surface antigen, putative n=1 Tax=Bodo saltans TaxID=75058 RepID=A0A0S4JEZ5_BODSA|nr:GP46-like surface antigen, putative [Bodo saltans]|eukprot:CUG87556.1 GP46-like surface antigen, putative [Bodo saltans]